MDISSLLSGYSKALYSTWVWYRPDHLLIDCGEGCASTLGNSGFAIERVLLTHGHIDHISGLPSLLWSRAGGMGDNLKPLAIYYPRDDSYIADLRLYLERTSARLPFPLQWIPLDAGQSFALEATRDMSTHAGQASHESPIRHRRRVETFATRHIKGRLTLGFKIVETRRRLKPEYASLPQEEIRRIARESNQEAHANRRTSNSNANPDEASEVEGIENAASEHHANESDAAGSDASANVESVKRAGVDVARGKQARGGVELTEEYDATLAAFGGDGLPLDPETVRGCELLLHEATILDASERRHQWHSTLDEAVQVAAHVKPKAFVLQHVSGRYRTREIEQATRQSAARHHIEFPIWCLFRDRLWNIWPHAAHEYSSKETND